MNKFLKLCLLFLLGMHTSGAMVDVPELKYQKLDQVYSPYVSSEDIDRVKSDFLTKITSSSDLGDTLLNLLRKFPSISRLLGCHSTRNAYGGVCPLSFDLPGGREKRAFLLEQIRGDIRKNSDSFFDYDKSSNTVSFNYIGFASGRLLQDFIILNMIVDEVKEKYDEAYIKFKVIFIDTAYTEDSVCTHFDQFKVWFDSLEKVQIELIFYDDFNKYIDDCRLEPSLKADILVCADFDISEELVGFTLKEQARFYDLIKYDLNAEYSTTGTFLSGNKHHNINKINIDKIYDFKTQKWLGEESFL